MKRESLITSSKGAEIQRNRALLTHASIEIFPSPTISERMINTFGGSGKKIAVTSSPNLPIESTIALSASLLSNGFQVIPHIGAYEIENREHLERVSRQIGELGIGEIFVIQGDSEQKGIYHTSSQMLNDLARTGIKLDWVGIAGYPEGIPGVTEEQLFKGIRTREKIVREMGANIYVVTQMCFDINSIVNFINNLRNNSIDAPVIIGLPAPEKRGKLFDIATRCRVRDSKQNILEDGEIDEEFLPEKLVDDIALIGSPDLSSGYHIYSFNRLKRLQEWFNDLEKA